MERRQVRFEGRVQGVGFRATTRMIAKDHPVTGWVRNEPDGSVRLEAQGDPADLDHFVRDILERGAGRVERHLAEPCTVVADEHDFTIH